MHGEINGQIVEIGIVQNSGARHDEFASRSDEDEVRKNDIFQPEQNASRSDEDEMRIFPFFGTIILETTKNCSCREHENIFPLSRRRFCPIFSI